MYRVPEKNFGSTVNRSSPSGYTLLEIVIAFAILLVFIIPLISYIYKISVGQDAQMNLTGMCLLEQEAAIVSTFPDKKIPEKRKILNGREWVITTAVTGRDLLQYKMNISEGKHNRGEIVFYGRVIQ